ncbi:helix-turn-helix transcriptional regulator [Pseudonocardia sp. 73-21]|uniref:helix-turn-helix domain-containing protein n=1 Tax=Pseudonocardia sp. 73-21 TaxID=1895809 RepID=UPI00341A5DF6
MDDHGALLAAVGLRRAIARINATQTEIARRLGCSVEMIRRYRAGIAFPTDERLARLARLAGVDQDWIRNGGEWN